MMKKEETGHCWVVRWRFAGKPSVLQDFFQVLPWHWQAEKVTEYIYSLYYNSPTRPVAERTDWINSKIGCHYDYEKDNESCSCARVW